MPSINNIIESFNVAELLDEEQLNKIGAQVIRGYELDEESRAEWQEKNDKAMEIAKQTMERKSHPFPGASNVKYPLITRAAIDFASRTYPEIVQGNKVVNVGVIGEDPTGEKANRAERVKKFLTYQLLHSNDDWEESTDRLLHVLPIIGTVFKKTYYSEIHQRTISEVCMPDKICVNYNVQSLESARRVTHIIPMYANDILERIRSEIYLDVDIDQLKVSDGYDYEDEDPPLDIIEQHCYLDLDEDGYSEPYIVVAHKLTQQVLRIVARFDADSIEFASDEKTIRRIEPIHYFTDYHFLKSPDGSFYSVGLGQLLYPLNESINTTINQLIDAGTLYNSQNGFIGRGMRIKGGQVKLKMGEFKVLDAASGVDIRNNVVPMPHKEPSMVLFRLLELMLQTGKDLSSVQDTMQGKGPTQNVPATTILTMVEQGLKVFNAIQKRLYRAFRKEFNKLYDFNRRYLDPKFYNEVLDSPYANAEVDFENKSFDIIPVADPSASSDIQRVARARALMEVPGLDPFEQTKQLLEAMQVPEQQIAKLLPLPDPNAPPPPELQKLMAETEAIKAKADIEMAEKHLRIAELELKQRDLEMKAREAEARIEKSKADALVNYMKLQNVVSKQEIEAVKDAAKLDFEKDKAEAELAIKAAEASLKETDNDDNEGDV